MHVNGKLIPVKIIPGMQQGGVQRMMEGVY
jgi:hypothetical protein